MSAPTVRPEIARRQDLKGPPVLGNPSSIILSSFDHARPVTTHGPTSHGIKRKASEMDSADPDSPSCLSIKQEPGSPDPFEYRRSSWRDIHPKLDEVSTRYGDSSRSDDRGNRILDTYGDDDSTGLSSSKTSHFASGRFDNASNNMSVFAEQEAETGAVEVTPTKNDGRFNGFPRPSRILDISPPLRRQKASNRRRIPHYRTGKTIEDVDYTSIPDYSPPVSSLPPGNPNILQVGWREKAVIDLSKDPNRHLLHEAERALARTLNLSCAKYLCAKRRMFQARFEALRAGREFKKTAVQEASHININKASKLCTAFIQVGWFDEKYFLEYLDENNNSSREINNEKKNTRSPSSGLSEPGIWDVSESEFYLSSESEEDEESADGDIAGSSVYLDGMHENTEGLRNLDSYLGDSSGKEHYGHSLIGGDGSQEKFIIDRTNQSRDTLSGSEIIDEGPMTEDRRSGQRLISPGTIDPHPGDVDNLSRDGVEESPLLQTRSRTRKIKLALNSQLGDNPDEAPTIQAKTNREGSASKNNPRRSDSCEIPRKLLLAAEAKIQEDFERERADIIAEIDNNFQSEKWTLVAEAMSRNGSVTYSADLIHAQYERLMGRSERAGAKKDEKKNMSTRLPRRATHTFRDSKNQTSTPSKSRAGRVGHASTASTAPHLQHPRRSHSESQIVHHGKKVVERSHKCENCGRKYESRAGLIYHHEFHNCSSKIVPVSQDGIKMNLNSYENLGHEKRAADNQGSLANPHASPISFPNLTPPETPEALPQVNRLEDPTATLTSHSVKMQRVWAIRRALGTNGRYGGPPKAKAAKKVETAVASAAPNSKIFPPTVTNPNGHPRDLTRKQVQTNAMDCHDTNPVKQYSHQVVSATSQSDTGPKEVIMTPSQEVIM